MFSVDDSSSLADETDGSSSSSTSSTSSLSSSTSPASPTSLAYPDPDEADAEYDEDMDVIDGEVTKKKKKKTGPKIPVSVCSFPCKTGEIMIMNTVSKDIVFCIWESSIKI